MAMFLMEPGCSFIYYYPASKRDFSGRKEQGWTELQRVLEVMSCGCADLCLAGSWNSVGPVGMFSFFQSRMFPFLKERKI